MGNTQSTAFTQDVASVEELDELPLEAREGLKFFTEIDGEGVTEGFLADQPGVTPCMSSAVSLLLEAFGPGLKAVYDADMNPYYQRGENPSA